ncbi:hypothetical protein BGZ83_011218 [Gryganskiella cystojenkinii]|nr:hypothetical protein BGZ83_011218 [Gryganskiella cystojenkinii]
MEEIIIPQRKLSNRQMGALVSLWKLSHYRQAPFSSWSILYSSPRPKDTRRSPMICFETKTYELLKKQQEEELKAKKLHQHKMWQHVQDRLAEQNKALLEQEGKEITAASGRKSNSKTGTNGTSEAAAAAKKRSIKWSLDKNITKSFDKNMPITLVPIPAVDKRPAKSALKVRTPHVIHKGHNTSHSDTKKSTTGSSAASAASSKAGRKHASDFF